MNFTQQLKSTSCWCLKSDWVSCPGSILVGSCQSHSVLYSWDGVHPLLCWIAGQTVLLYQRAVDKLQRESQGLCLLVGMLSVQRPCDLRLISCDIQCSHICRSWRRDCNELCGEGEDRRGEEGERRTGGSGGRGKTVGRLNYKERCISYMGVLQTIRNQSSCNLNQVPLVLLYSMMTWPHYN